MNKPIIKLLNNHELTLEEKSTYVDEEASCFVTQDAKGELRRGVDVQREVRTASIEEFVNAVAFPEESKANNNLELIDYYSKINSFLDEYSPSYFYSPKSTLFYDAIKQTPGLSICHQFLPIDFSYNYGLPNPSLDLFDDFIATMKHIRSSTDFKDKYKKWKENFDRSYSSMKDYIDTLFLKYSRLLVVRLDLGFKQYGESGEDFNIERTKKLLAQFLNAKRSNKVFDDVVGYVWRLEYGSSKGYHYHLLIFLNGADAQRDIYRGLMMGQYWISLTQGEGVFYLSNFKKRYFAKHGLLGVGMVSYFERDKRKNLDNILRYFFKPDQYLKEKPAKGTRMCGKGEISSLDKKRLGRTRRILN